MISAGQGSTADSIFCCIVLGRKTFYFLKDFKCNGQNICYEVNFTSHSLPLVSFDKKKKLEALKTTLIQHAYYKTIANGEVLIACFSTTELNIDCVDMCTQF